MLEVTKRANSGTATGEKISVKNLRFYYGSNEAIHGVSLPPSESPLKPLTADKYRGLRELLASYGSCVVAYSGGVDSVFLAQVAHEVLGDRSLAAIADSPSLPRRELLAGYAEVVKYGLINDPSFFLWLEEHGRALVDGNEAHRLEAVATSVKAKADIVGTALA